MRFASDEARTDIKKKKEINYYGEFDPGSG